MPTPIPDGYTPHATGKNKLHLRGPDATRPNDRTAYGPTLCGDRGPASYVRGGIRNLEQITCNTCRVLGRHAAARLDRDNPSAT